MTVARTQMPLSADLVPLAHDAELIGVYRSGVRLMALRALHDQALADDVAQETLARVIALIRANRSDSISNLGAFVHGIARNVIGDVLRARKREALTDSLESLSLPSSEPDGLALAIAADERSRIGKALRRLSPGDRAILEMCFVQGLGLNEVSACLQEPETRIRKRKSRALERLRSAFFGLDESHVSDAGATASIVSKSNTHLSGTSR